MEAYYSPQDWQKCLDDAGERDASLPLWAVVGYVADGLPGLPGLPSLFDLERRTLHEAEMAAKAREIADGNRWRPMLQTHARRWAQSRGRIAFDKPPGRS